MATKNKKIGEIIKYIKNDVLSTYNVNSSIKDLEVRDICFDSREVRQNSLYVANKGKTFDGHHFLDDARASKACCCLVSELQKNINVPQIQVQDTRKIGAKISNYYYDFPSKNISVIGITGSSGKTSTSWILASILKLCGKKVDAFGSYTSGALYSFDETKRPDVPILEANRITERIQSDIENSMSAVVMEVNSYDLALKRVKYTLFSGAIFTNISYDHVDYHGTFKKYLSTKRQLGKLVTTNGFIVVNKDSSALCGDNTFPDKSKLLFFSTKDKSADIYALNIQEFLRGTNFDLYFQRKKYSIKINLVGTFQVQNCMAAILTASEMGISVNKIIESLKLIPPPPGRYQILEKNGVIFVIDYAHNENSLIKTLDLSRSLVKGNIIAIYGGEWDGQNQKRSITGEIVGKKSDLTIITTNNPKHESLSIAIQEIKSGVLKSGCKSIEIPDRKKAIRKAIKISNDGDLVIILGSGHHNFQQIGDKKYSFNDYSVVKKLLENAK